MTERLFANTFSQHRLAALHFPAHVASMTKSIISSFSPVAPFALLVPLILVALVAPVQAQTSPPSDGTDRAQLSSCLRDAPTAPRSCIGSIAVPCVSRAAATNRAEAEVSCAKRETTLWRERMDAASGVYAQSLDAGLRSRFTALQRSWESYVAQKCGFTAEIQPPARMATMQSGCDLQEVASRSIEIERSLRGQQGAQAPRRNQQPRIER